MDNHLAHQGRRGMFILGIYARGCGGRTSQKARFQKARLTKHQGRFIVRVS